MKNLLYILLLLPSLLLAQVPEGINYQALIRDASGVVVANQNVGIQLSLLQGSASGSAVYKETFSPTTNDFGLVNLQIGAGTPTLGTFSSIDWGNGTYFIETAVDVSGGTSYVVISTTQFMSVPYALYAKNSGLDSAGVQGMIDANPDLDADSTNELQTLSYSNDTLSISNGNQVSISSSSFDFIYPDGKSGLIPINDFSGSYTVPTGKNLYVTKIHRYNNNYPVSISGNIIYEIDNFGWSGGFERTLFNPLIVGSNETITSFSLFGFLIDALVQPICVSANYQVPSGKILVILNVCTVGGLGKLCIGSPASNNTLFYGYFNTVNNSSGSPECNILTKPVLIDENVSLERYSLWSQVTINGYLMDK